MAKTSINYDKLITAKKNLKLIRKSIKQNDFFAKNFKNKRTKVKENLSNYDFINVLRKKCVYRISPDIVWSPTLGAFDDHTLLDIEGSSNNSLDFENETESRRKSRKDEHEFLIVYHNAPVKVYWSKIIEECGSSQSDFNLAPLIDAEPYNKLNAYLKIYTENINNLYSSYANIQSALNVVCDDIDKAIRKINKMINAYKGLEKQNNKKFGDRSATKVQKQLTTLLKYGVSAKEIKIIAKELGYKVKISHKVVSIIKINKGKNPKSSNGSSASKTGAKVLHGDVVDANLSAIAKLKQRLKKALKNGKKKNAYSIYKSLVGLVGVNQAKKYLSNLGYKVGKNSNGEKIIKQIKDEKVNDKSSNNNGDKKKEIPEDPQKIGNDDDKKDDKPESPDDKNNDKPENPDDSGNDNPGDSGNEEPTTPEENPSNNDNSGGESNPSSESVATSSEDNNSNNSNNYSSGGNDNVSNVSTNNDNYSDSGSSSNDSSGDGLVFDDASSDNSDSSVDASTLVPSDDSVDNSSIDDVVSTPTKKVKTLEDDTTTSTSSSKSGLGVAVPLGLGVIATGAAAVAGARYIKNKKESTYDDNYDDENNDLGDDNSDYSYSDTSSNYDSDSYMSDDYLGPAGSSYTDTNLDENSNNSDSVSDSYIDSEEYEDDSNDDDLVLRDLN